MLINWWVGTVLCISRCLHLSPPPPQKKEVIYVNKLVGGHRFVYFQVSSNRVSVRLRADLSVASNSRANSHSCHHRLDDTSIQLLNAGMLPLADPHVWPPS